MNEEVIGGRFIALAIDHEDRPLLCVFEWCWTPGFCIPIPIPTRFIFEPIEDEL